MTCYRNDHHPTRVLVGRHVEPCDGTDCHGCQPCPDHHCASCHRVHAPDVCAGCLGLVRVDLHAIGSLVPRLPTEAVNGRPAYHVHSGIPGGDAVSLGGPGHYDLPRYDTPPVVVLDHWAVHWWGLRSDEPVVLKAPVVVSLVGYLDRVLGAVTGYPEFLTMAGDLTKVVRRLEDVLYEGDRPDRSRVPCWECGTRLVKVWATKVRDDHWLCPRCGETYDAGRYDRAKHDHLASTGANRFVSVSDATVAIGRPVQTVRSWIRREQVDTIRDTKSGRLLVWWPDIRNLHLTQPTRRKEAS